MTIVVVCIWFWRHIGQRRMIWRGANWLFEPAALVHRVRHLEGEGTLGRHFRCGISVVRDSQCCGCRE